MRISRAVKSVSTVAAAGALVAAPPVTHAAIPPRWFINGGCMGCGAGKHEPTFSMGRITLKNATLKELTCQNFTATNRWNEVREGTERGFGETTAFTTWECKAASACQVTNENGVKKEGVLLTAEGPPTLTGTEKPIARHTGNTSLPWTDELTEKGGNTKEFFVLTHKVKVWIDIPVGKEKGGPGEGLGCELLGGSEIAFEDQEGTTEKAAGDQFAPAIVNGLGNGLHPSREVSGGETGLGTHENLGRTSVTLEDITTGGADFELLTAREAE